MGGFLGIRLVDDGDDKYTYSKLKAEYVFAVNVANDGHRIDFQIFKIATTVEWMEKQVMYSSYGNVCVNRQNLEFDVNMKFRMKSL